MLANWTKVGGLSQSLRHFFPCMATPVQSFPIRRMVRRSETSPQERSQLSVWPLGSSALLTFTLLGGDVVRVVGPERAPAFAERTAQ